MALSREQEANACTLLHANALESAQASLMAFTCFVKPDYEMTWFNKLICRELFKWIIGVTPRLMITMPPRHGKLLSDTTSVPTPKGRVAHGDLKPGDSVFHPSGKALKVLAVSSKDFADLRLTFSNGQSVTAHEEHEWKVYDRADARWKILETKKLYQYFEKYQQGRCRFQLELVAPLEGASRLPESYPHPYALGAWLGDGSSSKACISYGPDKKPVVEKIISCGYEVSADCVHSVTKVVTTYFKGKQKKAKRDLWTELKTSGVIRNKHIPRAYFDLPVLDRLELIAGMIDTDGSVCPKTSRVRIVTTSLVLKNDLMELLESLSQRPYVCQTEPILSTSGIQGRQTVFSVGFQPTMDFPTVVEKKRIKRAVKQNRVGISKIERVRPESGNCIQVDSEDGLYCVGDGSIVTHNSELISRHLPAFLLGRYPKAQIMTASYSPDLASQFNRDVQKIMSEERYGLVFPKTKIASSSNFNVRNASMFEVENSTGFYRSVGIGGALTGMGASHFIIDDPIKNRQDADSKKKRDHIWDWWTSTASTRLEKDGRVLVVNTRWHEDDLSGRLLKQKDGIPWRCLNLPAAAFEEHDPDRHPEDLRETGTPLWPAKFSPAKLEDVRLNGGERDWWSLWQGRPRALSGAMFKDAWFSYYDERPKEVKNIAMFWDLAFKGTNKSDYNAGLILGVHGSSFYVLDVLRFRGEFPELLKRFQGLCIKWPEARAKWIEGKANGDALHSSLKDKIPGMKLWNPIGDKVSRVSAILPFFESGNVHLPRSAPWLPDFITELLSFPNGANDDQVDALTMGLLIMGSDTISRMEKFLND